MPKLKEILFGKKDKVKQLPTQTPQQKKLMDLITQGLTNGQGAFGELFGDFNPDTFNEGVTQPALKNFQENILPHIQEKFIAGNQVQGSGLRRAQLKAGTDLQSQLANLMYQAQNQQNQTKLSGINTAVGNKGFENIYKQGDSGVLPSLLKGGAPALGQAAGGGLSSALTAIAG